MAAGLINVMKRIPVNKSVPQATQKIKRKTGSGESVSCRSIRYKAWMQQTASIPITKANIECKIS